MQRSIFLCLRSVGPCSEGPLGQAIVFSRGKTQAKISGSSFSKVGLAGAQEVSQRSTAKILTLFESTDFSAPHHPLNL